MGKKKVVKKKVDTVVIDEDNLPVISLDDCETFDPSADKKNRSQSDDDWEDDIDEKEDFSD